MSKTPVVCADRFSPVSAYGEGELFCPGIGRRILKERHQARALQDFRGLQATQFGKGWIEVQKFGNMLGRLAVLLVHPWNADDEGDAGGFLEQVLFLELVMLPQQVTMIAREHDDGVLRKSQLLECVQDPTRLRIHVGNARVVGFEQALVQFGRDSVGRTVALVVANDLRHVFQVVFRHHGGDHRVAVIAVKIFGRGNQGYVWTYKAAGEKKGLSLCA